MTDLNEVHNALDRAFTKIRNEYTIELDTPEATQAFYDNMKQIIYNDLAPILPTSQVIRPVVRQKVKGVAPVSTPEKLSKKPNHYARLMTYLGGKGLPLQSGGILGDVLPGIHYQVSIPPPSEYKKTKGGDYPEWVRWVENVYPANRELCDAFITTKRSKVLAFAKFFGFEGMSANSFIWTICMPGNKETKEGVKHTWASIIHPMIQESGDGKTYVLRTEDGPVTFDPQPNPEIEQREAVYDELFAKKLASVQQPVVTPTLVDPVPLVAPPIQITIPVIEKVQLKIPVRLPVPSS